MENFQLDINSFRRSYQALHQDNPAATIPG